MTRKRKPKETMAGLRRERDALQMKLEESGVRERTLKGRVDNRDERIGRLEGDLQTARLRVAELEGYVKGQHDARMPSYVEAHERNTSKGIHPDARGVETFFEQKSVVPTVPSVFEQAEVVCETMDPMERLRRGY